MAAQFNGQPEWGGASALPLFLCLPFLNKPLGEIDADSGLAIEGSHLGNTLKDTEAWK